MFFTCSLNIERRENVMYSAPFNSALKQLCCAAVPITQGKYATLDIYGM